ncbi:glutathione hydrolase 1 proenzyme-like [Diorhabda carinulata]|uniref:glutathione hydrolase 1 proenzyme-like n=1 Tax=Diorhabda carinulata TaxID=1163345 RepID=UPI0025A20542|nr:glutathione hydrolase 1 proenzyme-like [Diorhabda carinulata]
MEIFYKNELMIILAIILLVLAFYVEVLPIYHQKIENVRKMVPPDPVKPLPPSGSKMLFFKKAAVCADAALCAKIGLDILQKNGSAVDAAIAAMICNSVVNMQSAGLGGGFFMTIYKKDENKTYCLNAREKAPLTANGSLFQTENATSNGSLSVGVPGEIKGYLRAHEKFGKLQWSELVQPSIELCEKGYLINDHQYSSFFKNKLNKDDENLREWFIEDDGSFKKPGNTVRPSKLCNFLKLLSENGPEDFYTGTLAKMFLEDVQNIGGIISEQDMREYDVDWLDPIETTLQNGDHIHTFPAPGSGAILIFILNILDGFNLNRDSIDGVDNTVRTYQKIIETFKYAYAKRTKLGDPNFVDMKQITQDLLCKKYAESIRLKLNKSGTSSDPDYYGANFFSKEDHGTAHVSIIAENGDAVSATSTVNIYFGAGVTSKQTGIILNSVMDDFSYSHLINYFGLSGSPANIMQPGKRPFSSMIPTIITDSCGNVKVVIGGAGGPKIITSTALVLIRLLWLGENIKEAIDAPRIHHQLFPMEVHYEYGVLKDVVEKLRSLGHEMNMKTESIVYALYKDKDKIVGTTDNRKPDGGIFGI